MSRLMLHRAVYLHEAERNLQLCAQTETDALLARVSQPDPVQMCAVVEDEPPLFTRCELVVLTLVGVAAVVLFAASLAGALA